MTRNLLKKSIACAMAAMFLSFPLAGVADAASHDRDNRPPRQEQRVERRDNHRDDHRKPQPMPMKHDNGRRHNDDHRKNPPPPPRHDNGNHKGHYKDKDKNGNAVTGFIIGAVVGAVIANNI